MKTTSHWAAVKAVVITVCALSATSQLSPADTETIPSVPVGWITASPTVVQTGTKPDLVWSITYPSVVEDFVQIIPPATINPTEEVDVEIRVLGNGVTLNSGNSYTYVNAQALLSFDGGSYGSIFYGSNHDVNPSRVVWSRESLQPNQELNFGGRYYYNGWGPRYRSTDGKQNVRTLVNGDTPPDKVPSIGAPSLEDFIRPYLDDEGKVSIGPMDVIVFMELTHDDDKQDDAGYDMQDLVLLVTFTSNKPKNNDEGSTSDNDSDHSFMEYDGVTNSNPNP
ncbi:MAG: hypothetical protein ACSHX7_03190 [Luteolibacter sp.]